MVFGRLGILGVVAALVVSLVVLVPPGAAEAVDPGVLDVTDFVVLGVDGVYLKQGASVTSGDVGAVNATSGPYLAGSQETTIGLGVTVAAGSRVFGDSVKLKQGSTVGDVYTNDLSGDGTVTGAVFTPVSFPLNVTLPAVPVAQPGVTNFDVTQGGSLTIDAGSYGLLKARNDATVTLTGGVYEFSEWDIRDRVAVEVLAPSQIVVAGRVATGKNSALTLGAGVEPYDVELTVLGVNGNTGKVGATPKAAKFGLGSTVSAVVWVPNGTVWLRQNAQGQGQFIGRWVTVGIGVTVERSIDVAPPMTTLIVSPAPGAVVFDTEPVIVDVDSTTAVSVDLEVDSVVVASSPINAVTVSLSWDTTGSVDGGVVLRAVVRDAQGTQLDAVSIDVVVANDDLSTMDRILVDYGQGRIDADMFVESGFAALQGSGVETRYQSTSTGLFGEPADPDADGEATQIALSLLAAWPNMSPEAQARISSMGTVGGPISGTTIPAAAAQQQSAQVQSQSSVTPDCLGPTQVYTFLEGVYSLTSATAKTFECRTVFEHSVVYWNHNGGTFWSDNGTKLRKDRLETQIDLDNNGIPDQIDLIGEQQDEAWAVYKDLGYEQPDSVNIYVHDMGYAGANVSALVLPTFVQYDSRLNQPGEQPLNDTLARHEQFHVAQFDTLNVSYPEAAVLPGSVRWWMEATANWAAHQVNEAAGAGTGDYSAELALLLKEPERSLVEEPGFITIPFFLGVPFLPIVVQVPLPPTPRAYGTFILAEYLDENLTFGGDPGSGNDAVLRTFLRIRDGFSPYPGFATTA